MFWLDELSDPEEMSRCVQDLLMLSALPAAWGDLGPAEICDSLAAALISVLDGQLAFVAIVDASGASLGAAAYGPHGPATDIIPVLRRDLGSRLTGPALGPGRIANPFKPGEMQVATASVGGGEGTIVVGSDTPGFPSTTQRLLVEFAASQTAIAIRQWQTEKDRGRDRALVEGSSDFLGIADLATVSHDLRVGISQVAGDIAYELSQPLTAAGNSLSAIRRLAGSGNGVLHLQTLEIVEEAAEQVRRAGGILQHLRQLVMQSKMQRKTESISSILDDSIAIAMLGAEGLGIRVAVRHDATVSQVDADRGQVQQVIVNLVRNAIEAMRESPRRELTIEVARRGNEMVEVSVADSGASIPREFGGRLDLFTSSKEHGLEAGLSASKSIVRANGGDLTMGPSEQGGAVFRFTLMSPPLEQQR